VQEVPAEVFYLPVEPRQARAAFLLLLEPFSLRESCLERRLRSLSFFARGLGAVYRRAIGKSCEGG
jgi:hypothetical protein